MANVIDQLISALEKAELSADQLERVRRIGKRSGVNRIELEVTVHSSEQIRDEQTGAPKCRLVFITDEGKRMRWDAATPHAFSLKPGDRVSLRGTVIGPSKLDRCRFDLVG